MSHRFHELSYPCNTRTSIPMPTVFYPAVYYCYYYRFYFLLLLLFHYYHHYKTVTTDKPLRVSLFPGVAELTNHLLRLINILWLPLCRINKFGFYFPRRLLRSPILVGHQCHILLHSAEVCPSKRDQSLVAQPGESFPSTLPWCGAQSLIQAIHCLLRITHAHPIHAKQV
jgi:hypothetical protein